MFDTPPAKRRPDYANIAVENSPGKLVLFENPDASGTLNHIGVERMSMDEVQSEAELLEAAGPTLDVEGDVVCCYARQDKHWATGPDGQRWENYVVLADAHPELEGKSTAELTQLDLVDDTTAGGCCSTARDTTTNEAAEAAPSFKLTSGRATTATALAIVTGMGVGSKAGRCSRLPSYDCCDDEDARA